MPRALSRTIEARQTGPRALALGFVLWLACSPPDGEDLYTPLGGSGGAAAGVGGGGSGGSASGGAGGQAGSAGTAGAGAGGLAGAGNGGVGPGGAAGAESAGAAGAPETPDAGASPDSGGCVVSAEICNGLDDDCDGVADPEETCSDGCAGVALDGRGYMFCAEALDRASALASCTALQMNLAWIETPEENDALVAAIAALGISTDDDELLVQIGASDADDEETWVWVPNAVSPEGFQFWEGAAEDDGGEAVDGAYQNWTDGEPNDDNGGEDCAVLAVLGGDDRDPGQWDDRSCETGIAFVCEAQ